MPKEGSVVLRSRRRHQYRHTRHNRSIIRRFLKTSIVLHTMKRIYHSRITIRHHFIELFHGITLGSAVVQWATWLTTLNCFATPPRRSSEQIARAACRLVAFYSSTINRRRMNDIVGVERIRGITLLLVVFFRHVACRLIFFSQRSHQKVCWRRFGSHTSKY